MLAVVGVPNNITAQKHTPEREAGSEGSVSQGRTVTEIHYQYKTQRVHKN